jgi:hypothetical protein
MSREWLAVYSAMVTKPKYRRLTPTGRGALLHVLILSAFQTPEAAWEDPEELREALHLEGFPAGAFDELMANGWLEVEDGAVVVHDWDQHQLAATKEAQKAWEAKRKRDWRRTKKVSPTPLSKKTEQDTTPQHIGPGHVPDMSGTPGLVEVVNEYERLYGPASAGKVGYLTTVVNRWPFPERVIEGLKTEQRRGATPKDICGRLEKGLKNGDQVTAASTLRVIEEGVPRSAV